jgi:hypothetical protein
MLAASVSGIALAVAVARATLSSSSRPGARRII